MTLPDLEPRQAPALPALLEQAPHVRETPAQRFEARVLEANGGSRFGRRARDARAHEAGPQHSELLHADLPGALGIARVLLDLLGREEHGHQRPRHLGDRQSTEGQGLDLEAFREARRGALAHHLDRLEGRRVVAAGLRQHRLPRLREDERPQKLLAEPDPGPARDELATGDRERRLLGRLQEDGLGHHLVHEARLERARGLQGPTGEDQVEAPGQTDEPRQALRPSGPGQEAELHLGQTQRGLRVVGGDAVAAGQDGLGPAPHAGAVDRRDHGHRQRLEPVEEGMPRTGHGLPFEGAADPQELVDVGPRDEVVGLAAREHDGLDRAIGLGLRHQPLELFEHRLAEGIHLRPGDVEGEHQDAVLVYFLGEGPGLAHRGSAFIARAPWQNPSRLARRPRASRTCRSAA